MIVRADAENIQKAATIIRSGGLVAFPTETVYGLGANALDAEAVIRIFKAKGRPFASPIIVHVADLAMARALAESWPPIAETLARSFWPGPLTIVVKKASVVPDVVTANLDAVGIRHPSHPIALELIRASKVPIAAPSANRFTEISPTLAEHVEHGLNGSVELILDGGPTQIGIESTVVSVRRCPPEVLRPGMISLPDLERVTGVSWERAVDRPKIIESPGQHPRHYSPKTLLVLLEGEARPPGRGKVIALPRVALEFGRRLYAELHQSDAEGWDWIGIEMPPDTEEWAGIRDRLRRASADSKLEN
jgi:L-threonylcarbamoyladenylate synthase